MSVYSTVPLKRPKRTFFPINYNVRTSFNIGQLVPTARPFEAVPGDSLDIFQSVSVDLMPLVAPFKGDLYLESWCFFVSNDILYRLSDSGKFTDILTASSDPSQSLPLPYYNRDTPVQIGSLFDYYGIPISFNFSTSTLKITSYPTRAYYLIFDEFFRDENLQQKKSDNLPNATSPESILNVNYKKDRFTSAFTSPQKGNTLSLDKTGSVTFSGTTLFGAHSSAYGGINIQAADSVGYPLTIESNNESRLQALNQSANYGLSNNNSIRLSITIDELRLLNKLQLWQEKNQLCGSRPKEYLLANYGVAPNDETLQRPALIGHIKVPVIVNSVVQNNPVEGTTTGTKTGNAVGLMSTHFGKWRVKEFGWIITLSALRPKASYMNGIHRSLIKNTVYDFFNPIFESLGQEEIYQGEIYADGSSNDSKVWGYTDRYNSMRYIEDMTTGALRSTGLAPWSVKRTFASAPTLSDSFLQVKATEYDYLFNFQSSATVPQAVVSINNKINAIRPISKYAHPSL